MNFNRVNVPKRNFSIFIFFFLPAVLFGQYSLEKIADMYLPVRCHSSAFSVGQYGYVIGGMKFLYTPGEVQKDFQRYDPGSDSWTKLSDFPEYITEAASFSIGSKGYVVTGRFASEENKNPNLYVWDTLTSEWITQPVPPEIRRIRGTGFSIAGKGYVCLGIDTNQTGMLNDLWEFDPLNGSWTRKADFPGVERYDATCFVVNNKAYITNGFAGYSTQTTSDLWEYDPLIDQWIQRSSFPGMKKAGATGFGIGNFGYIFSGLEFNIQTGVKVYDQHIWEYNQTDDSWQIVDTMPGSPREAATGFIIDSKCYLTPGYFDWPYNDSWEFDPPYSAVDITCRDKISIYPNPCLDNLIIKRLSEKFSSCEVTISDLSGRVVFETKIHQCADNQTALINISNLKPGCYLVNLSNTEENYNIVEKIIKQ
jgi:N-acetylneuraminic acid mutarotase